MKSLLFLSLTFIFKMASADPYLVRAEYQNVQSVVLNETEYKNVVVLNVVTTEDTTQKIYMLLADGSEVRATLAGDTTPLISIARFETKVTDLIVTPKSNSEIDRH